MVQASHTLIIVRHAKAEAQALGAQGLSGDHRRELTTRGRADAGLVGRFLAGAGYRPDHALISSAARTVQTWAAVRASGGWPSNLGATMSDDLYGADTAKALELIGEVDEAHRCLVMVGHNPTMEALAWELSRAGEHSAAHDELSVGFPTAAVAVFEVTGRWQGIGPEDASLRHFQVPRSD